MKLQLYSPSEVLKSVKEPYNKNTLWIQPFKGHTEIKVYNEGWKLLFSTKDLGLSDASIKQVKQYNSELKDELIDTLKKLINSLSRDVLLLTNRIIELEKQVAK